MRKERTTRKSSLSKKSFFLILTSILITTILANSFVLAQTNNQTINQEESIVLLRQEYVLGEAVFFTIQHPTKRFVEVHHNNQVFRILGDVLHEYVFQPVTRGEYVIRVFDHERRELANNYFVVRQGFGEQTTKNPITTNKDVYTLDEQVNILFDESQGVSTSSFVRMRIITPTNEFALVGEPTFPMPFYPSTTGEHEIVVMDNNNNRYTTGFVVIREGDYAQIRPEEQNELVREEVREAIEQAISQPTTQPQRPRTNNPLLIERASGSQRNLEISFFEHDLQAALNSFGEEEPVMINGRVRAEHAIRGDLTPRNNVERGRTYDVHVRPQQSAVNSIIIRDFLYEGEAAIRLEDLPVSNEMGFSQRNALRAYAIEMEFAFDEAYVTSTAVGTELFECKDWDFDRKTCTGVWQKIRDIIPGEEYSIRLEPGDPGYIETGVASINTKKPIYRPGETAEMIIVVLDNSGYLVSGADVTININNPNNSTTTYSTEFGTITEESVGIYTASFPQTSVEGTYQLFVQAQGTNTNSSMITIFLVQEEYAFDIIRDTMVTLDPAREYLTSSITLTSFVETQSFSFTEVLPENFTIVNAGGAIVASSNSFTTLTWNNLTNNSVVSYVAQVPEVIPWLWTLGPSYVEYTTNDIDETFFEARPWYLAADPITYYDPNSNIQTGWADGTGTGFGEISKGTREPTTPSTATYISVQRGSAVNSEFGFPDVVEDDIESITLWIYRATGSNVGFDFEFRQGTTSVCGGFVGGGTSAGWQSCVWNNPSGNLNDLRVFFGEGQNVGGGKPQFAFVYAAYIEVETATPPPDVFLISPADQAMVESSSVTFTFRAEDTLYSTIDVCTLYTNSTGTWAAANNQSNVLNNTNTNIIQTLPNGVYLWNVLCDNSEAQAFAAANRTVFVNLDPPLIADAALNETSINQGETVRFSATITDFFGIDAAKITLRYPDSTTEDFVLDNSGSNYFFDIITTSQTGTYNISSIWANDTLGRISEDTSSGLTFSVQTNPINNFSLITPLNNSESRELNPTMTWNQTITNNFDNYTLQISKDDAFGTVDFTYSTSSLTTTEFTLTFALEVNQVYYWRVLAYDTFGNVQESNEVFRYVTDRTTPTVTLNQPSNNAYVTQNTVLFNYTPNDTNTISSCSLYTNSSGTWQSVNTSSSITKNVINTLSGVVVEGPNLWNVRCEDEATNAAFATTNRTVILDTTGPIITLLSPANNTLINDTNIITFEAQAFDELASLASCSIYIDDVLTDTDDTVVDDTPFSFVLFLANNVYLWRIECTDTNNNTASSQTRTLEVLSLDNDPPVIVLNSPSNNAFIPTSTITFNYTPQDATGVENCSLVIDGDTVSTDFSVTNFEPNTFVESGFVEDTYLWNIVCYDNSTQFNKGESNTRTFTVDLTDPVVTLDSPSDNAERTTSSITFLYTPSDLNLDSCSLYTNESGVFTSVQTTSSPSNNVQNSFVRSMPDGVFAWNVLCNDFSGRNSFANNNRTLLVDTTPPQYANQINNPSSPATYNTSQTHVFSIEWTDNFGVDTVFFEHNFSGTLTNVTPTQTGNTFSFNTTGLDASSYSIRWYANDTFGNTNQTTPNTYVVNKAQSIIELRIDGVRNNLTVNEEDFVSLNATLTTPSAGLVELLIDGIVVGSGNTPFTINEQFFLPGVFEVTAHFNETNNYLVSTETFFVEVLDITPPSITLINPSNDSLIGDGEITFSYSVSDNSAITSCSIYIDSVLETTNNSITKDTTQFFFVDLAIGVYSWRIECTDSANNTGVSETRLFEAVDADEMIVTISFTNSSVEIGSDAEITTTVTDLFSNPLVASVQTSIINSTNLTSAPWWNSLWTKRKPLTLTEDTGSALTNGLARINLTGLSNITSCTNSLRIIDQSLAAPQEVPFTSYDGDNSSWCSVAFEVNMSAFEEKTDHYIYYDNPSAPNPNYGFSITEASLFNAGTAAADEGTPTDVANIIGLDDTTFAIMTQGGGGGTHSAHGRDFVPVSPSGDLLQVEARYRYEVPAASSTTWQLRYSTNAGTTYTDAFSGGATAAKTTSAWADITSAYPLLSWAAVDTTRLQGRMVKAGGGGSGTVYLYWVELRVTYLQAADVSQGSLGLEERLVASNTGTTSGSGELLWMWNTGGASVGNYSVVSLASRIDYTASSGAATLEIVPDLTPPVVELITPVDGFERGKGLVNFTYRPYDINLASCTLFLGLTSDPLLAQETNNDPINNESNTFEDVFVDIGLYEWNVNCVDDFDNNASAPQNYLLNVSAPDLVVRDEDIWFADVSLIEGVNMTVFANITNEGLSAVDDSFVVQFFLGDPAFGGVQIGLNKTITSLASLETVTLNNTFLLKTGNNNVFVLVDPDDAIEEADSTNNKANNTVSVETYQYYYGNISIDIILGDADISSFVDYLAVTNQRGHVFFADEDSSFNFANLQAVTRNIDGNLVTGDFDAVDNALGISDAQDSIKVLWGGGTNTPVATRTFNISTGAIPNVPIIESTEYEEFVTGILWDTADDTGNLRFDVSDREDLVFVTKISPATQGLYGVYDYEILVPSALREYAGSSNRIAFYVEIN